MAQKITIILCVAATILLLKAEKTSTNNQKKMAEPNWGLLEKSQVDNETIEEAIDRLITAHNDDADAHIGTGKSLDAHKTQEVVDHPAGSIVEDKIPNGEMPQKKLSNTEIAAYITFESMDGWTESGGSVLNSILGTSLQTSGVINTKCYIYNEPSGISDINTYNKDTFFQTAIQLSSITNQEIFFMTGGYEDDDSDSGFGFKIVNGTLYAIIVKAVESVRTEYTTQITGITLTNLNIYSAFFDVSESKIYFYVNGVLKHTETTNLPEDSHPVMFIYSIENTEAANKILATCYLYYSREI